MKLISCRVHDAWRPAFLIDDVAVDAAAVAVAVADPGLPRHTMSGLLALGADHLHALARRAADEASRGNVLGAAADLELGPPVPDPQKIVCLGLNYRDHAREVGADPPAAPMFFAKFPNSLVGPRGDIVAPPETSKVDYEAELAIVIGRRCYRVAHDDALNSVFGAMCCNDVSARDLQLANQLWTGGKAVDTFAPTGPALVSTDELGDLQDLGVRAWVNGDLVQDGTTADMIFSIADSIAFLSRIMTLEPGDLILTGTPAGVGQSRNPPRFLEEGDTVEVEIDGLGRLCNRVRRLAAG